MSGHAHAAGWCALGPGPCQHERDCPHPMSPYYREPLPVPPYTCGRCGVTVRTLGAARLHLDRQLPPEYRRALRIGYGR